MHVLGIPTSQKYRKSVSELKINTLNDMLYPRRATKYISF
jgi:hypothetical protein